MANKQTILVIEDEKTIGNYIETILLSNEYKVLRAMYYYLSLLSS